jgi:hypothetical protein
MTRSGAVVAAVLLASGCSFLVVRGPRADRPPNLPPACTELPIAPVVDTGLAVLAAVGAITAHRRLDTNEGSEFPNNDFLRMQRTFSIIGLVLEAASGTYGFVKTTRCRRARNAFSAR